MICCFLQLGEVVVELVGMVMNASWSVLNGAHQEDRVFSRQVASSSLTSFGLTDVGCSLHRV
jgi:hypothetical protein